MILVGREYSLNILPFDPMAQEEKPNASGTTAIPHSSVLSMQDSPTIGSSTWGAIFPLQKLVLTVTRHGSEESIMGHHICLWEHHVQAILRPRNLLDHLTENAPSKTGPLYKRWVVEEEVFYTWIFDSMISELANRFIKYSSIKAIWDVVHKFHSKKNDRAKIAQLVTQASSLQQGEKLVLTYANELSDIFSELDHYHPLDHELEDKEYILMDPVYKVL